MDLMESGKSTRYASRGRRKMQPSSPSDSVIILGGNEKEEEEVEMESGSEEVNLETGLDVEDGELISTFIIAVCYVIHV